jgi:hypothetical protein
VIWKLDSNTPFARTNADRNQRLAGISICSQNRVFARIKSGVPGIAGEFLKQFQEVERLPNDDKSVVKTLLDTFLTNMQLQTLAL